MALTDEHWAKLMTALAHKAREAGGDLGGPDNVLSLIKENWELLGDEKQLDTYNAECELAEKQATRDQLQETLDQLDAEIALLEEARTPAVDQPGRTP
jgi:hypothetical protein